MAAAATADAHWPDPEPEFLTRKEAAAVARVNTDTIGRWQREGKLSSYGLPRHKQLVNTAELRKLIYGE